MDRIFLIRPSCQDKSVFGRGEGGDMVKSIFVHQAVQHQSLSQRKLNTHQETGMLVFPLVIMQFFSSGLIMVG